MWGATLAISSIIAAILLAGVVIGKVTEPYKIKAPHWIEKIECRNGRIEFLILKENGAKHWSETNHRCE